jgi:transposase
MASSAIILVNRQKRKHLVQLARRTTAKLVFRRCQIILQLAQGMHPVQVAHNLACAPCTVYRTRKLYLRDGLAGLKPRLIPGRPCKLTNAQIQQLDATLAQEPRALAQHFSNWSARALGQVLGLSVHAVTVLRHLWRLGWRWRRPRHYLRSPDPRYAAKARYVRRLRQQARRGQIQLYFSDEMDVALLPTLSGRWMRIGQQTQVLTPGQNAKQYVFGAVNYRTGAFVWSLVTHKDHLAFLDCLKQLAARHATDRRPIVVVADNFRIHKALAVQAWLRFQRPRLRVYFLPTYAPQLNPIERVWRHVRRNVTHNYFFGTMPALVKAVTAFLAELANSPQVILNIVA